MRRKWQPTPVLLPGKSHGRKSVVVYSSWGCKELDTTEQLHYYDLRAVLGIVNSGGLVAKERKKEESRSVMSDSLRPHGL